MGFLDKIRGAPSMAGHHGEGKSGEVQDPVCHMWVDPAKTAHHSEHGASSYHFCSAGCKKRFDADPHRFLGGHAH